MEKLKLHTPDMTEANIEKLAGLFPQCVTEAVGEDGKLTKAIDFDQLRQELSSRVIDGPRERYQFTWPGKKEALLAANAPIPKTLRPYREESVEFDTTKNLFIEGDNLDALKLLQETYLGQVKLIYIDPPYNTGKDFIYKDNFSADKREYEIATEQRGDDGGRLVANTESNGRYHSDWLSMIYPRLRLARNLLREDGVIFISIDDHEQASLRKVCDEIFGEANFIAQLVWEKGRKNDAKFFSVGHEYILIFARSLSYLREKGEVWREEKPGARDIWDEYLKLRALHGENNQAIETDLSAWYSGLPKPHPAKKWARYKRVDKHGPWRDRDISWPGGDGPRYDVMHPGTKLACAVPESGWRYSSSEEMQRQIKLGLVEFRHDHTEPPFRKAHIRPIPEELELSGAEDEEGDGDDTEFATQVRGTYFYKQSQVAVRYLRNLMGTKVFTNPKDHEELAKLIGYATPQDNEALIVDFFAGSASSAEAVLKANAETGSRHRFIVVQLPEDLANLLGSATGAAKKTTQSAVKLLTKMNRPGNLAEISKERIRRAGKKIAQETPDGQGLDVGFRVLKVDSSNMRDVYYAPDQIAKDDLLSQVDNIHDGRTGEDLLFQVLIDWGVDLSLPIAKQAIDGKAVYFVDENALAACFEQGVNEELVKKIAARKPLRAVFRDNGFSSDSVKINVEQIFKLLSPVTDVKSI